MKQKLTSIFIVSIIFLSILFINWNIVNSQTNSNDDYELISEPRNTNRQSGNSYDWDPIQVISEPIFGQDNNDNLSIYSRVVVENDKIYIVWGDESDLNGASTYVPIADTTDNARNYVITYQLKTDPLDPDTDDDGLKDGYEVKHHYSESKIDWDGDGDVDYYTNPLEEDTDNDGFSDRWDALDWKDAKYLIPQSERPNPLKKDIYVEVDWMDEASWRWDWHNWEECGWGTRCDGGGLPHFVSGIFIPITYGYFSPCGGHELPSVVKTILFNRFDAQDIELHIDDGSMGGGGDVVNHINEISQAQATNYKNTYFYNQNPEREDIFHWALIAHRWHDDPDSTLGITQGRDGFLVFDGNHDFVSEVACTFMHELGHNLGLTQARFPGSGIDNDDFSMEEYPSSMNYNSHDEVIYSDGTHSTNDFDDWGNIDLTYFI